MPEEDNRSMWSLWTLLQRLRDMLERDELLSEPAPWADTVPVARPREGEQ